MNFRLETDMKPTHIKRSSTAHLCANEKTCQSNLRHEINRPIGLLNSYLTCVACGAVFRGSYPFSANAGNGDFTRLLSLAATNTRLPRLDLCAYGRFKRELVKQHTDGWRKQAMLGRAAERADGGPEPRPSGVSSPLLGKSAELRFAAGVPLTGTKSICKSQANHVGNCRYLSLYRERLGRTTDFSSLRGVPSFLSRCPRLPDRGQGRNELLATKQ